MNSSVLRSLGEDKSLAVVIASESLGGAAGTLRTMAVSSGEVRSMDQDRRGPTFPGPPAARPPQRRRRALMSALELRDVVKHYARG